MATEWTLEASGAKALLNEVLKAVVFARPEEPRAYVTQFLSPEFSNREVMTCSMVKSETDKYLASSGAAELLSAILTAIVYEKPADARAFVAEFLAVKASGTKQAILTDADCTACFNIFAKGTATLTAELCRQALAKLRLGKAATVPAEPVTLDAFLAACRASL